MTSFTKPLIVTPLEDGERWELVEEFEYHVGSVDSNEVICVPQGFITDFASIPRIFWNILPPWGKYGKAAIIYDYLYSNNEVYVYDRKRSDQIFLEGMEVLNVPGWKRNIMYLAVRIFANYAFHKKS